jgi:lipopolysaccharide/colanic/teichoic acid biosynthesis glycosyltransferase
MQSHVRTPAWKRALDLACCMAVLPLLALCTLVMALVMKIVSPGPVFFRQERVGFLGRRFKIYKFRTMKVGSDTANHQAYFKELVGTNAPMQKLDSKGDSRLIPGGWMLRASGLDELPQLINVLRGDMSVVGPRPCLPAEYDLYLPWQKERFTTLPGLTGLWQVSGKNRTTFDEMIRLDIRYAQTKSLPMDMRIMLTTPMALLLQIYDTRMGRKSSALNQTHPPMPMSQVRMPEVAGNR